MNEITTWRHVFKLDPNKEITDEQLEQVCESGTDAIIVGGTDGVTLEKRHRFACARAPFFRSMCIRSIKY